MSRIQPAIIGKTPFERLLGHDERVMRQWPELGDTLTGERKLSTELKEQVRRTLAVGFAEVFLTSKGKTSASSICVLQEAFTDDEVSELCAFIAFMTASQYIGGMFGLQRENPLTAT